MIVFLYFHKLIMMFVNWWYKNISHYSIFITITNLENDLLKIKQNILILKNTKNISSTQSYLIQKFIAHERELEEALSDTKELLILKGITMDIQKSTKTIPMGIERAAIQIFDTFNFSAITPIYYGTVKREFYTVKEQIIPTTEYIIQVQLQNNNENEIIFLKKLEEMIQIEYQKLYTTLRKHSSTKITDAGFPISELTTDPKNLTPHINSLLDVNTGVIIRAPFAFDDMTYIISEDGLHTITILEHIAMKVFPVQVKEI